MALLFFLFFLFSPPCRQPARLQAFLFEGHLQQAQVDVALDSLYFGILWVSKRLCSIKVIRLGVLGRGGGGTFETHSSSEIKLFLESERGAELSVDCSSKMPPPFPGSNLKLEGSRENANGSVVR